MSKGKPVAKSGAKTVALAGNAHRGESSFVSEGKTYTFRITTAVLARLEDFWAMQIGDAESNLKLLAPSYDEMLVILAVVLSTPLERGAAAQVPNCEPADAGFIVDGATKPGASGMTAIRDVYWPALINAGILDREKAEEQGLIPKDPKGHAVPSQVNLATETASAGA